MSLTSYRAAPPRVPWTQTIAGFFSLKQDATWDRLQFVSIQGGAEFPDRVQAKLEGDCRQQQAHDAVANAQGDGA